MAEITRKTKAYLVLASGDVFEGWSFGALAPEGSDQGQGEVVFNTSLTGYQEILTDPSYQGQIVVMTPSHIGNYGINEEDVESSKIYLSGFVVQELSEIHSNWRAQLGLHEYLSRAGVPGIAGVDTRALTRLLRTKGAINGLISTNGKDAKELIKKAKKIPSLEGRDLVKQVGASASYPWTQGTGGWLTHHERMTGALLQRPKKKVVVMDFGVKQNILRCLVDRHADVVVVPATYSSSQIMALKPDGVLLSNGPGDPAAVDYAVNTIKSLVETSAERRHSGEKALALFGICLGHQLLGLALGGKTYKLKFGHHGANHPIKDLDTGQVDITTQNHGFAVAAEKREGKWVVKGNQDVLITHLNLNDNAVEGLRHRSLPIFSVQYHPEASSGPHDARHLFDRFFNFIEGKEPVSAPSK